MLQRGEQEEVYAGGPGWRSQGQGLAHRALEQVMLVQWKMYEGKSRASGVTYWDEEKAH